MLQRVVGKKISTLRNQAAELLYLAPSVLALLQNNWMLLLLIILGTYFRKEVKVTMKYVLCIVAIAVFESDKRRKIGRQTKYYIIVMWVLMAEDLGEKAVWIEEFIAEEVV